MARKKIITAPPPRRLTPIQILIDAATGFRSGLAPGEDTRLKLCCPSCRVEKMVPRRRDDPPAARTMSAPCPRCWPAGMEKCEAIYRDAEGNEVATIRVD